MCQAIIGSLLSSSTSVLGLRMPSHDRFTIDRPGSTRVLVLVPTSAHASLQVSRLGNSGKGCTKRGIEAMARCNRLTRVFQCSRKVLLALVVVAATVGCSDDDSTSPSSSTMSEPSRSPTSTSLLTVSSTTTTESTTSSTTSTPAPSGQAVEDQIIARYLGYWNARLVANNGTPDPDDPGLREYATGPQLDSVISETRSNLEDGLALREADDPAGIQRVDVVEVDGLRAVVQECVVDDAVVVRRGSGEIINDAVATHNVRGELEKVDGRWRVSKAQLIQRWEGIAGCALVD